MAAWPALALAVGAQAQAPGSVQDYRLPPAPTPTPTAAGPVDSDHPVATPTRQTPAPSPAPSPVITLPSPTATTPAAEPATRPTPRTELPQAQPAPRATPTPTAPEPEPAPPIVPPAAENLPAPTLATTPEPTPVTAPTPAEQRAPWPWIAGGAAFLLLLGGFLAWRRRDSGRPIAEEPAETQPQPGPPAALMPPGPRGPASPPPPLAPSPSPVHATHPLEMQLEARHLSRALVNATLAYRLTLTNRTDAPIGPLRIAGDIVSAHASLSAQEQLAPADAALAPIHEVPALAPGESLSLSGELRLPIASILPMHSGGARVFVPLARFRAETQAGTGTMRIFVIGHTGGGPDDALRPFPLDRGPGIDRAIGQRELGVPA